MKKLSVLSFLALIIMMHSCQQPVTVKYPETKKVDVTDDYHGNIIADPYRWLEDDRSEETAEWVRAQNEVTFGFLEQIPFRSQVKERLTEIWDYPRYSTTFKRGNRYFYFMNTGMQNQSVLYVQENLDDEARVLLDPNLLSDDGTVSLASLGVSKDGKYFAYGISRGGSDWNEIFVMEIESGNQLDDHLKWIKFSGISWHGNGFYYSRYDEPAESELSDKNEFHKVFYHQIGTSQDEDKLIFENKDYPLRNYYADVTDDERFLIIYESESTSGNALYIKDLTKRNARFEAIVQGFDHDYTVVDDFDGKLLVRTNYEAPKYRLIEIDPAKKDKKNWKTILPEQEEVLNGVTLIGGRIVAQYMKDAYTQAFIYDMTGKKIADLNLPGIGTMGGMNGDKDDNIAFYAFTSFTYPTTIYKFDMEKNESTVYRSPEIDFDASAYETKQVFYESKDGTKVPMFIVHKKGLIMNGKNPTLLYGYGGFNVSLTPSFSVIRLLLLEQGGVFAMPNLRGGGEYGKDWHDAGTKEQKQNVFDDFIAAAEFLIDEGYTSSNYLAIQGGSNGGLLVGAIMTQRPDLVKVALPAVGVFDMLRYHLFTIGWAWATDYGRSDAPEEFDYLIAYSPLHNVKYGTCYPATLITTADHDDRVVPAHSFKFAATVQEHQGCNNPVLIRIDTKAGHGAGKPTAMIIEEYADLYAFMFFNMGFTPSY